MKQRQHFAITRAVLAYYGLPPHYAAYANWPDEVPKLRILWRRPYYWGTKIPAVGRVTHHYFDVASFIDEFRAAVRSYKKGADGRKMGLANMVKTLHYVQDGCIEHYREGNGMLVAIDPEWLVEGERIAEDLMGLTERVERLAGIVRTCADEQSAVRTAVVASSAVMGCFLREAGARIPAQQAGTRAATPSRR